MTASASTLRPRLALRAGGLLVLLCLALAWTPNIALGAEKEKKASTITITVRPGQPQEEIEAAIKAASASGHTVSIVFGEAPKAAPVQQAATPTRSHLSVFQAGLSAGLEGIAGIPALWQTILDRYGADAGDRSGSLLWLLALVLAFACACAIAVRSLIGRAVNGAGRTVAGQALRQALADLSAVALLYGLSWGLVTAILRPTGFAQTICADLVRLAAVIGLVLAFGRFMLAPPGGRSRPLIPIPNAGWHRGMLNAYGIIGLFIGSVVMWAQQAGGDEKATEGVFLLGASFLTVLKLIWFGAGRHDVATLFAGHDPGPIRRVLSSLAPWLFIAIALGIWVVGCMAAISPQAAHWGTAAGATQLLTLLVPTAALGIDAALKAAMAHTKSDAPPLQLAIQSAGRALVAGSVWVAGLYAILLIWRSYLVDASAVSTLVLLQSALKTAIALVVGWAILRFLRTWFGAIAPAERTAMPGEEGPEESHPASRLSTILPLFRDMLFGVVVAVTLLVVLSSLGVDIAPLLAGFGVIGLALSFGSQALVRDIVSGIFFIADDAFRIGEYLDTGRHKGTVERMSLRSLRLRHQNGQFHTVPFGQIQAVTNFSRDWSTVKFELRFEPDADPETIRKVVKKVGLALLEEPEFGPQFLQPLKMQGIQELTPNAMVIRLKFSAKPGNPAALQRQAVKRLLPALRAAHVPLASNAVTVRSGSPEAAAAAVAQAIPEPAPA